MPKTPSERQASFRQKQKEKGLEFFQAWVPKEKLGELKKFVKKLLGKGDD